METFNIELNPLQKKYKWSPYGLYAIGVVYLLNGIMFTLKNNDFYSEIIWFIGGIIMIISGYHQNNFSSKYFIELNDQSIKIKNSISRAKIIEWSKIKEIHLKPMTIELLLDDSSKEIISLGNTSYKNVLDIKDKLKAFAVNKEIYFK